MTIEAARALSLLNAAAVRDRAHRMLEMGLNDELSGFRIDLDRLGATADLVLAITRKAYPTLDVPFHSRWRHFVVDGVDRWAALADATPWRDDQERARAEFDLAIISVLLDAGAGPSWRYRDSVTGARIGRSEGLALASLDMFARGLFSAKAGEPLRADAAALERLTMADLQRGFQIADDNPLVGLEGRVALLRRLGEQVSASPQIFAARDAPRPGGLFDHLAKAGDRGSIAAPSILSELLLRLGTIWPSRITLDGIPLGDCWRYPVFKTEEATGGLMPRPPPSSQRRICPRRWMRRPQLPALPERSMPSLESTRERPFMPVVTMSWPSFLCIPSFSVQASWQHNFAVI